MLQLPDIHGEKLTKVPLWRLRDDLVLKILYGVSRWEAVLRQGH